MAADEETRAPAWVEPMLAKADGGRLRSGPEWAYEYKLDGYRAAMRIAPDGTTILTSRNNIDFTAEFAELDGVLAPALDGQAAYLDGEIVVYGEDGRIDFELMQERRGRWVRHQSGPKGREFSDVPVRFLAFDLLRLGDRDLLATPYDERRALLASLPMPDPYRVSVVRAVTFAELAADRRTPADFLAHAASAGYEGVVAKLRSSAYVPGQRPDSWLKHPLIRTQEVIVCGWRPGQRSFTGTLGGLLLGAHDPETGALVYIGDVGTGFSQAARADLKAQLEPLERRTHPFVTAPPREDTVRARWVEPRLVGEVVYRQFTRAGRVRHTAWRGLRADKDPADVIAPRAVPQENPAPPPPEPPGKRITVQAGDRRLTLSNLDKVLYPADGFTKGEVINYYSRVAPVLLPHLAGRPVTFIRYPDGVDGEKWFGKNVPNGAPSWLRTARLPSTGSRGSGDTIDYPLLDDLPGLVWAANIAALELHVPQWTVDGGARGVPDRLVFDLDPGPGTSIVDCCRVAERLHDVLVADGLTPYAKTSGSKGMQLYCGIATGDPAAPSAYAKRLAQRLAKETPETVTAVMAKAQRAGRVFIDWSQNNPAKTTVAPYSLRGRDHPTVSTPVTWDEVRACRHVSHLTFTADDVLDRVAEHGDLLAGLATERAPLP
ncbi:bifunctional non-homologous end joining protein LigD [Amycolatopsis lexingtonensis]|uniref:DNA ligase (ATP) n=1 Tax=Amycolatopsis lexingtonensis TaxID=218822 RepID=A0ABR9HR44_9PSEU|nr:DNA ligase D [Amycolatopsis lexingtonensis]MBE1493380.1 bifunctional non-homologous end joining protein LigD [Amycolatopsis lexingtonensis]